MTSIIIPAHNESAVIGRCLGAWAAGMETGEVEAIVVANGCGDDTAGIARRMGAIVIETDVPSKSNALNLGDAAASAWPRVYVDADVVLPLDALRHVVGALRDGKLAAAPRARFDLSGCSWAVRAFYRINDYLPSSREGIGGSGVYALSQQGRQRFAEFPRITADDGFVRMQFAPDERVTCQDCRSIVFAPRTLRELVAIKTRSHFGTSELRRRFPHLSGNIESGNGRVLRNLMLRPWLWPHLAAYAYVKIEARRRSRQRAGTQTIVWERDETSRQPAAA